jgi:hypothetical protein
VGRDGTALSGFLSDAADKKFPPPDGPAAGMNDLGLETGRALTQPGRVFDVSKYASDDCADQRQRNAHRRDIQP